MTLLTPKRLMITIAILATYVHQVQGVFCYFARPGDKDCKSKGFGYFAENDDFGDPKTYWIIGYNSILQNTGPRNLYPFPGNGYNFLMFNPAAGSVGFQAAYASPLVDKSGQSMGCVEFYYNMNCESTPDGMGSLYVVIEDENASGIQSIDPTLLKSTSARTEVLINQGNKGDQWFHRKLSVDLSNRSKFRVLFQVLRGTRCSGIAIGEVDVEAGQQACDPLSNPTNPPITTTTTPTTTTPPPTTTTTPPPTTTTTPPPTTTTTTGPPTTTTTGPPTTTSNTTELPGWGPWQDFTPCSAQCGWGTNKKTRYCVNPSPPLNSNLKCQKIDGPHGLTETISNDCYSGVDCEISNGGWTAWEIVTECSMSCGGGEEKVSRNCTFPAPSGGLSCLSYNGSSYIDRESMTRGCNTHQCPNLPISLNLGAWGAWSQCSGTCGYGQKTRTRTCEPQSFCGAWVREVMECSDGCRLYVCPSATPASSYFCNFENQCFQDFKSNVPEFSNVGRFTPSMVSGATQDHTFPTGCGNFLYYNSNSELTEKISIVAAPARVAVTGQECISFYVNMYSSNSADAGQLMVYFLQQTYVRQSLRFLEHVIWKSVPGLTPTSTDWYKVNIDINNIDNVNEYLIVFAANDTGLGRSDISVDDFMVTQGLCDGKVDGYWSNWKEWSACNVSCGTGYNIRKRACDAPVPRNGGDPCVGLSEDSKPCTMAPCVEGGDWIEWGAWRECSVSCDNGTRARQRFCGTSGSSCTTLNGISNSTESQVEDCNIEPCDRDGNWGGWSEYSQCSTTCGDGQESRSRACDNPVPRGNGLFCHVDGPDNHITALVEAGHRVCTNNISCPINGVWGDWTNYGACNNTCGAGLKTRTRACDSPPPQHNGLLCADEHGLNSSILKTDHQPCVGDCNVNGTWTDWGSWSSCSTSCGPGVRYRNQTCSNTTGNGISLCGTAGDMRSGDGLSGNENCNIISCDAFGNWGNWSYAECSVTCGFGTRNKSRLCNNPPPGVNGLGCETAGGQTVLFENVPDDVCFVNCTRHGGWSIWTNDTCSPCDSSDGKMNQTRECNNPTPLGGGDNCTDLENNGALTETRLNVSCFVPCSINGSWSDWVNTSSCNLTCGGGYMQRERHCDDPKPVNLGLQCLEIDGDRSIHEIRAFGCNNFSCPIDGEWSLWTGFSNCLPACGETLNKTRTRNCTTPQFGGLKCLLENGTRGLYEVDSVTCGLPPCIVQPGWAEFGNWSECSASCTPGGKRFRTRKCEPSGNTCPLGPPNQFAESENRTEDCNLLTSCAVNGSWSDWENITGTCNVTCGVGVQQRNRTCNDPPPSDGGDLCEDLNGVAAINETSDVTCVLQECMINGSWSSWEDWTDCSTTCGNGTATRNRTCDNPPPSGGGLHCFDLTNSTRILFETEPMRCFIDHCPDPYDCSFDVDMCNYTSTLIPSRWLRDQNETHTQDTGPIGPQKGSHYAFYESSSDIPPGYPGGGQTYTVPNSDSIVAQYPSFQSDRCLEFYWFANQTIFAFNFGFGMMDVYQTSDVSGSMIQTPILNVTESHTFEWKRQLHQLTNVGNPFTLTFFANATSHNGDKHIDSIRFYDMLCSKVDELIIPIPN